MSLAFVRPSLGRALLRRLRAIGGACLAVLLALQRWRDRNASARALRQMDDRMLADIGMTRAEVRPEITRAFWGH